MMKRLYFPLLLLLIAWASYGLTLQPTGLSKDSTLQLEATPITSTLTLDGHTLPPQPASLGPEYLSVAPGTHTIIARKQGFTTAHKTVTVTQKQSVYAGLNLQPNNAATFYWYVSHPFDELKAQAIGTHEADYIDPVYIHNNPFLSQLPLSYGDGQGGFVQISQGVSLEQGGPPAVYISADFPAAREGALTYMQSRGYNPAIMDLVFSNTSSPLDLNQNGD